MLKENQYIKIKKQDLPKKRDPFHRILSAKAGASGRMSSEADYYQRHQTKIEAQQNISQQRADQLNDEEKELTLKNILAEIEQWAGEDALKLGEKIKKAEPQEKGRWYLAALKDELADEYYQQSNKTAIQQKKMVLDWIQQLEKLIN